MMVADRRNYRQIPRMAKPMLILQAVNMAFPGTDIT